MYVRARTLDEAVQALETPDVQILAGGTDFYPAHVGRTVTVPVLDITGIGEISGIATTADHVRIGAGATWSQLIATPLPACFDALKAAAREVGSVQIQNRATIAGNLCNASPAADGVPPLLTLDAEVELLSRAARGACRSQNSSPAIAGPSAKPTRSSPPSSCRCTIDGPSAFVKLGARRYLVISIAMVAAVIERDGKGAVAQARIAVGSCSAVARRLPELEQRAASARPASPVSAISSRRAIWRRCRRSTMCARAPPTAATPRAPWWRARIEQCVGG